MLLLYMYTPSYWIRAKEAISGREGEEGGGGSKNYLSIYIMVSYRNSSLNLISSLGMVTKDTTN